MCRNRVIWVIKYPKENDHLFTPKVVVKGKKHRIVFLTRAWPGGGRLTPPLPNIRDSSKTNNAIDVKLGRPSHTTIWHRPWIFFWNPSEIFWDIVDFVTSLHATFGRKLAELRGSVEGAVFNENANKNTKRRKMRRSTRWLSRFFKILGFWPLKFQKIDFLEYDPQNPKYSKFSKNRNICYSSTSRLPVYKISSQ